MFNLLMIMDPIDYVFSPFAYPVGKAFRVTSVMQSVMSVT